MSTRAMLRLREKLIVERDALEIFAAVTNALFGSLVVHAGAPS